MEVTVEKFSRSRCITCYVMGVFCAVVTALALVALLIFLLTYDCRGGRQCGWAPVFMPLAIGGYILVPLGILSLLFRLVSFRSSGKLVPRDYMQKLKIGQRLMLTPWIGVVLMIIFGLLISFGESLHF